MAICLRAKVRSEKYRKTVHPSPQNVKVFLVFLRKCESLNDRGGFSGGCRGVR